MSINQQDKFSDGNKPHKKATEPLDRSIPLYIDKFTRKPPALNNFEQLQILDGSSPQDYFTSLERLDQWVLKCLDEIRLYIQPISYPLFVYLYLELLFNHSNEATIFLKKYAPKYPAFKSEINELALLKHPINENTPIVNMYLKSKVHLFIPKTTFNFLIHFLNTNRLILILAILNNHFEISNILSKIDNQIETKRFIQLMHSREEIEEINCRTPIYYNKVNKDLIDIIAKGKGRMTGEVDTLSKVIIPFPEQYNELIAIDVPSIKIDKSNQPTIGCFTVLNTNNKLNCADMTNDGGIIACGFKDGSIIVWILNQDIKIEITEEHINELQEYKGVDMATLISNQAANKTQDNKTTNENDTTQLNQQNKPSSEFVYDLITQRHRKITLYGHSASVYAISISPDNENIISGSFDGTVRLWNIHTKTTVGIYKGHFSPVLSVKFSPISHYFASGGSDRTARLWSLNSPGALRIFVGHLSDVEIVDFHPNSLYLITAANDKTIRMWSLKTSKCVRVFVNYGTNGYADCLCFSNSGKIVAIAVDNGIILYDLIKMGDPISIVSDLTTKPITSIAFDNDDNVIVIATEDYKVSFFDVESILNCEDNLIINNKKDKKVKMLYSYMTKKTTILEMKFTNSNIMLMLGRFDDNDPKIFM